MTRRSSVGVVVVVVGALMLSGLTESSEKPEGVSPGASNRLPAIEGRCPAFSWVEVPDATSYELVVYELWDQPDLHGTVILDLDRASEVVYTQIPGGASSWTPALDQCLVSGGRFAWFVRAVFDPDTGDGSDWSEPLLFAVAAAPSALEVEHALGVLERYMYMEHGGEDAGVPAEAGSRSTRSRTGSGRAATSATKSAPRSVVTGTAAIRGEQPDPAGETYGVIGTSASPDGAGLGAANMAGGPDLVLDGSADGVADATFSQSGVDRPSAAPETFAFENTGGGGMTLEVEGVEVVTTATDRDTLAGLSCTGDEVAKWNGACWACAPDVDTNTDTLASLGPLCASGELARWTGAAWVCDEDRDTLGSVNCGFPNRIAKWNGLEWTCAKDDDTTYVPGLGVVIDNGEIRLDPAAFSMQMTVLDSVGNVGWGSSLAIGADGLGLIVYRDMIAQELKVAHCENAQCSSAAIATIGGGGDPSLAIGPDGLGLIAYSSDGLGVAHCNNLACTSARFTALDGGAHLGADYISLAIGEDGLGLVSYYDEIEADDGNLNVAHLPVGL